MPSNEAMSFARNAALYKFDEISILDIANAYDAGRNESKAELDENVGVIKALRRQREEAQETIDRQKGTIKKAIDALVFRPPETNAISAFNILNYEFNPDDS